MDVVSSTLDAATLGLAAVLAAVGFLSATRYRDPRLGLAALGLLVLGLVGAAGLLDQAWPGLLPDAQLGALPAALLLVSELLLYLSFVVPRARQLATVLPAAAA